jgi:hypothetical protein
MEHFDHSNRDQQLPASAQRPGALVVCVHCFCALEEAASTRQDGLRAKHDCAEELLARQPAAPPPFN